MITLPLRVVASATPRSRLLHLDLEGQPFVFRAGQAVMAGATGQPVRKPYSIASSPEDVVRDGRLELLVGVDAAGSAGAHLPLEPGTTIEVEGPLGSFTFPDQPDGWRFLFIAGGTGISPMRSMLRHALASVRGADVALLYSARTPEEFAFEEELRELAATGRIELRQTVTRDLTGPWSGARGRIDGEQLRPLVHGTDTRCFLCGPPALVADVPPVLAGLGVDPARIHVEQWG